MRFDGACNGRSAVAMASNSGCGRLKALLKEALNGREAAESSAPLRHRFRNAVDFGPLEVWWPVLMSDALMTCELEMPGFEVFTRAEHERLVKDRARGMMQERAMVG